MAMPPVGGSTRQIIDTTFFRCPLSKTNPETPNPSKAILVLGALGVVYGDIGTSPLYAFKDCFSGVHGFQATEPNILGVLSLIFWSLVAIISIKYMLVVLRADNRGEGGILALMALSTARHPNSQDKERRWLVVLGLFGAALLYGDGMITPAISVLGAVEGLGTATKAFDPFIVPISIAILVGLFLIQRHGTARIGALFGPILLLWFGSIGVLGLRAIAAEPHILLAVNPWYGLSFFLHNGLHGFTVLGSVFLVVTGGEALYADMGHFGRSPIRWGWFAVALPGLVLNYFGQGALLLQNPGAKSNPFYAMVPESLLYPMIALATLTAAIASQAVITGSFSLTRQAVMLGFLPRMRILHTSSREIGQIYVPAVNAVLMVCTIGLVIGFQSSGNLSAAYGVAVTTTMFITTVLLAVVERELWQWRIQKVVVVTVLFLVVDLAFWGSTLLKIPHGGWFALLVAAVTYLLMSTWRIGRAALREKLHGRTLTFDSFVTSVTLPGAEVTRVPGTAVFLSGSPQMVPVVLLHNLKYNKVLHERVIVLSVLNLEQSTVTTDERVTIDDMGHGFYRLQARYGFMESPDIKEILELAERQGLTVDRRTTGYYMGRESIVLSARGHLPRWRVKLFATMSKLAHGVTGFFGIPANQVIEIGVQIEL
ncbi:MAG: putative potassium transport system protein kup [Candidatus Hydrogenedentota bacterium]